ncbi:zinc finger protein ZIC 4-like isoform X1 [Sycon ciliatum]|uniref:zinc finger protein ZIC 4-like isoform X1 n=1 Tax=Sycon ciliatum TaxID=27933 RepID=UPI0031F6F132
MSSSPSTSEAEGHQGMMGAQPLYYMYIPQYIPTVDSQGQRPTHTVQEGHQLIIGAQPLYHVAQNIPTVQSQGQRPTLTGQAFDGTHQQVQTGLQAAGTYVGPVQPDSNISLTQPIANQPQPVGQQHSHIGQPVSTGGLRGISSSIEGLQRSSILESAMSLPPHPQPTIGLMSSPAQFASPYGQQMNHHVHATATSGNQTLAAYLPYSIPAMHGSMASSNNPVEMHTSFPQTTLNHLAEGMEYQSDKPTAPPSIPESPVGIPPHPQPTISTMTSRNSVPELLDTMASSNHPAEMHAGRPKTPVNHLEQGGEYQSDNPSASPVFGGHPRSLCKWRVNNGPQLCGLDFYSNTELAQHISNVHLQQQDNSEHPTQEDGNVHICHWDQCTRTKGFKAKYRLANHIRVHTGEKPFVCNHHDCTRKAFAKSANLKMHYRVHTKEKPFPCTFPDCKKRFSNSSDRKKHMVVHTNDKPYQCRAAGCTKRYTHPSSLKKHSKKHDARNAANGGSARSDSTTNTSAENSGLPSADGAIAGDGESDHGSSISSDEVLAVQHHHRH